MKDLKQTQHSVSAWATYSSLLPQCSWQLIIRDDGERVKLVEIVFFFFLGSSAMPYYSHLIFHRFLLHAVSGLEEKLDFLAVGSPVNKQRTTGSCLETTNSTFSKWSGGKREGEECETRMSSNNRSSSSYPLWANAYVTAPSPGMRLDNFCAWNMISSGTQRESFNMYSSEKMTQIPERFQLKSLYG